MKRYNPKEIQKKWQKIWSTARFLQPDLQKATKPFFNLMMFPYPSGEGLHVGHIYAFGGADSFGHFKKMQGFDVFEPIGFDSFGIHSENYALKVKKHPQVLIKETTKYFREEQLEKLGALLDWDHEVITSDIDYYRWTQWIFVQLFKAGLAIRKKGSVDWCLSCKTVLADEQVISGKCERCNSEVVQKELEQWFFKITNYAQRLLDNLDKLDWSETTKTMQRNWIGRSEGCEIEFNISRGPVDGFSHSTSSVKNDLRVLSGSPSTVATPEISANPISVFTTRPDTIFGATFMVVAPEHPQIDQLITKDNKEKVSDYINQAKNKSEVERSGEKSGVFTGSYAINPFTELEIPIYVADYVLLGYGTGTIMAVPAHDQRDFEFAKKYDLPIVEVISGGEVEKRAWEGEGNLVNSNGYNGLSVKEAKEKISEYIESNKFGSKKVNFHLRDWLISRQRYWGPPIPMIYCENCASQGKSWFTTTEAKSRISGSSANSFGNSANSKNLKLKIENYAHEMPGWYPVPEENLPVELPYIEDYQPKGLGVNPLASQSSFVNVKCPDCGKSARRETDVSDTFLDSSWYFLRYPTVGLANAPKIPFDPEITKKWLPVDMYIGGNEHAVLHLLYSRFVIMALHGIGLLDFDEPFKKFRAHGLIIHEGAKMSKSRGNIINPNEYIDAYGSDALRMYLLFIGPFDQGGEFNDRAISGVYRFLNRFWTLVNETKFIPDSDSALVKKLNKLIEKVTFDLENLKFNTTIAALMEFLNELYKNRSNLSLEIVRSYLLLLAPLAPFTAEELWEILGEQGSIHNQSWPQKFASEEVEEKETVIIQVDGHFRDKIEVKINSSKEEVTRLALDRPKIKNYTKNKQPKNIIWVVGKLLNIVQ